MNWIKRMAGLIKNEICWDTWAMMVEPSPREMVQDLSSQLPLILKSQLLSEVLEANITSS